MERKERILEVKLAKEKGVDLEPVAEESEAEEDPSSSSAGPETSKKGRKRKADQVEQEDAEMQDASFIMAESVCAITQEDMLEEIEEAEECAYGDIWKWSEYWEEAEGDELRYDSRTGEVIDFEASEKARKLELERLEHFKAVENIDEAQARAEGYEIVDSKWVEDNKGDGLIRSRIVGKQFKKMDQ